jgi:3-hydroxybutyryl-CoA dehydratase
VCPREPAPGLPLGPHVIATVPAGAMAVMTEVLGDPNPIHLDAHAVAALGLGDRRINQGPVNLGYIVDMLAAALPGAVVERFAARLLANVFHGDRVVASGEVRKVDAGGRRLHCDVWLDRQDGVRAVAGTAVLRMPAD